MRPSRPGSADEQGVWGEGGRARTGGALSSGKWVDRLAGGGMGRGAGLRVPRWEIWQRII
jgi:hypothetical protein